MGRKSVTKKVKEDKAFRFPKESKYPKKVYFSNTAYRIIFDPKMNEDEYGETNATKHVIRIRSGMSPRAIFTTFIHELLHVVQFEFPVNLKHKQIYKLEQAIFELLVDNFL